MSESTTFNFDALRKTPQEFWDMYLRRDAEKADVSEAELIDAETFILLENQASYYHDAILLLFENVDLSSREVGQTVLVPCSPRSSITFEQLKRCQELRGCMPVDLGRYRAWQNYLQAWLANEDLPQWVELLQQKAVSVREAQISAVCPQQ